MTDAEYTVKLEQEYDKLRKRLAVEQQITSNQAKLIAAQAEMIDIWKKATGREKP